MPNAIAFTLEILLAVLFIYWLPRQGPKRVRELAEKLRAAPSDIGLQLRFYRRFIVRWWGIACICAIALELESKSSPGFWITHNPLGPASVDLSGAVTLLVATALLAIGISLFRLWRSESQRQAFIGKLLHLKDTWVVIPRSPPAFRWFLLFAVTAGVCEEIAFRRLLPVFIAHAGDTVYAPFIISSLSFGLAHRYQGIRGIILTGILGAIFYALTYFTGSLIPAIALHALIDLRIGILYLILGAVPVPPES